MTEDRDGAHEHRVAQSAQWRARLVQWRVPLGIGAVVAAAGMSGIGRLPVEARPFIVVLSIMVGAAVALLTHMWRVVADAAGRPLATTVLMAFLFVAVFAFGFGRNPCPYQGFGSCGVATTVEYSATAAFLAGGSVFIAVSTAAYVRFSRRAVAWMWRQGQRRR